MLLNQKNVLYKIFKIIKIIQKLFTVKNQCVIHNSIKTVLSKKNKSNDITYINKLFRT